MQASVNSAAAEKNLCNTVLWLLYSGTVIQILAYISVFLRITDYVKFYSTVYYSVYAVLIFASLCSVLRRKEPLSASAFRAAAVALVFAALLLYTYAFYPGNFEYCTVYNVSFLKIFLVYVPTMLIASGIKDFDALLLRLIPINRVMSVLNYYFALRWIRTTTSDESLSLAYNMVICCIISVYFIISGKGNRVDILLLCLDILCLLVYGNRGALLAVVIYFAYKASRKFLSRGSVQQRLGKLFLIVLLVAAVYYLLPYIMGFLSTVLGRMGLSSRIIGKFEAGLISESEGRRIVYAKIYEGIRTVPPFGYGLLGDMLASDGKYYAHNIFLEFIIDFGWFFGIAFSLYVVLQTVKQVVLNNNEFTVMIGIYILTKLMFTTSFLIDGAFLIYMGLLCNTAKRQQTDRDYAVPKTTKDLERADK